MMMRRGLVLLSGDAVWPKVVLVMFASVRNPRPVPQTGWFSTFSAFRWTVSVTPLCESGTDLFSDASRFQLAGPRRYAIRPTSPGVVGGRRYAGFARPSGPITLGSMK